MGNPSQVPRVTEVKWLGNRAYSVEDLRGVPGPVAFLLKDDTHTTSIKVLKGSEMEVEIAGLLDK